jgi:hypothetical protein
MIVYEVIKSCSVSFRDSRDNKSNDFGLNIGDYIFLSDETHWVIGNDENYSWYEPRKSYIAVSMLKHIYYKKIINFDGEYEWTWIKNINIIDPRLNYKNLIRTDYGKIYLNDVSIEWNRDEKINNLLYK